MVQITELLAITRLASEPSKVQITELGVRSALAPSTVQTTELPVTATLLAPQIVEAFQTLPLPPSAEVTLIETEPSLCSCMEGETAGEVATSVLARAAGMSR